MNTLNVKKGDRVRIISGKDAGKEGKILTAFPSKERVIVEAGHRRGLQHGHPPCEAPSAG